MNRLPLLSHPPSDEAFIWHHGRAVSSREFLAQARALAGRLPQERYAINLCEDRYYFLLAFVAMLLRGQVNLLPANRAPAELQAISQRYDGCPCIVERHQEGLRLEQFVITEKALAGGEGSEAPLLDAEQPCAIVFTSGSTGESEPWEKRWGELYEGARLTQRMLALQDRSLTVVATVPPQHMYGLETTIVLPLVAGLRLHSGRPFFPQDLMQALADVPSPRLLVTTPVHLGLCMEEALPWPAVARIVSATAPLSSELAERAEQCLDATLHEIFGSTETGAIAFRRTSRETEWTLFDGLRLRVDAAGDGHVQGMHLGQEVQLGDRLRLVGDDRFVLLGRNEDMLKIAGKRVSLGDLNQRLRAIPGVDDGVFIEAPASGRAVSRLCAVVVAPTLDKQTILEALREQVDPVCLPRPIHFVDRLPRNAAGKLPRKAVLALLEQLN